MTCKLKLPNRGQTEGVPVLIFLLRLSLDFPAVILGVVTSGRLIGLYPAETALSPRLSSLGTFR